MKLKRYDSFDGLRAMAVLFVLLVHLPAAGSSSFISTIISIGTASKLGYLGVDIFFVLSGFLITRIISNEMFNGTFSFVNFYMRRSLRIFPVYFLVIAICTLMFDLEGLLYFLLFSGNYYFVFQTGPSPLTHTWSLAVEEQFYIIWPAIIIYLYGLQRRQYVVVGIIAFAIISSLIIELPTGSDLSHRLIQFSLSSRMLSLCLGGWIALHYNQQEPKNLSLLVMVLIAGLTIAYLSIGFRTRFEWLPMSTFALIGFATASTMVLKIFLYFENRPNKVFGSVFLNPAIRYIGTISYGIYVYHYVIFYLYRHLVRGAVPAEYFGLVYVLMLVSVFVVSAISFRYMERPLLKLKARYS